MILISLKLTLGLLKDNPAVICIILYCYVHEVLYRNSANLCIPLHFKLF